MVLELVKAFVLVFVAEFGDKSQILAMTLATKYKIRQVLIGVFAGILVNHAIAIFLGQTLGSLLNPIYISIIVGVIFVIFGFLSLLDQGDETSSIGGKYGAIITVAVAFFFGELGDKTQFVAMALSSESSYPWLILVSTVSAMMVTSIMGIYVGIKLGAKVPDHVMRLVSATLFVLYGLFKFYEYSDMYVISEIVVYDLLVLVALIYFSLLYVRVRHYRTSVLTPFQKAAKDLQQYYVQMKNQLDVICLGESYCGSCLKSGCLVGHTKFLIEQGLAGEQVDTKYFKGKAAKKVDTKRVLDALYITVANVKKNWADPQYKHIHLIRHNLEELLIGKTIDAENYEDYLKILNKHKESLLRGKTLQSDEVQ